MKFFILFSITVALVCSAPQSEGPTESQMNKMHPFTPDDFIERANRIINAYEEYMPAIIKKELTEMMANPDEVKAFCELLENARSHKAPEAPNTIGQELWDYFKMNLPLSAPRIERIEKYFEEAFNKISKPGQDYLTELYGKMQNSEAKYDMKTYANLVRVQIEEIEKYHALDESVKQEFNTNYPEIMKLINTPEFRDFSAKLLALKGKSDVQIIDGMREAHAALAPIYNKRN